MTKKFNIRQLHYQLGPGSLSYLRIHNPSKFGDRMDNIRFTIVDTNSEKTSRVGFEVGRIYSGLREVSPVWAIDPETHIKTYVGAVEVGTSFKQMLPLFSNSFKVDSAVLLSKQLVKDRMWPKFINAYFNKNPDNDYYIEASSSKKIKAMLASIHVNKNYVTSESTIIEKDNKKYSTYYFPIFDYQATKDKRLPPAGFVLIWEDVSAMINAFQRSFIINIIFSLVAFLCIEMCLLWVLNRENKLSIAERQATLDGLTGLYNRRFYDLSIENSVKRSKQNKEPLALIICDIDFFKRFNDTYGHAVGDQALRQVAKVMKGIAKKYTGIAARYGGEEFVIVLSNTPLDVASRIAEKLREGVESLNIPHQSSSVSTCLTISLGVSCSQNAPDEKSIFEMADANLYLAKEFGRNRVEPLPN